MNPMTSPRNLKVLLAGSLAAGSLWAAIPQATVSVSYSLAGAAVPVLASHHALGLLALFVGVLALTRLKGRKGRTSLLVLAALVSGLVGLSRVAPAWGQIPRVLTLSSGNPAVLTSSAGAWTVTNDLNVSATITGITVNVSPGPSTWTGAGASPCSVGLVLAPGASCSMTVGSVG